MDGNTTNGFEFAIILISGMLAAGLTTFLADKARKAFFKRLDPSRAEQIRENILAVEASTSAKIVLVTLATTIPYAFIYAFRFVKGDAGHWPNIVSAIDYFSSPQPFEKPQLMGFATIIIILVLSFFTYRLVLKPLSGDTGLPPSQHSLFLRVFTAFVSTLAAALAFLLPT